MAAAGEGYNKLIMGSALALSGSLLVTVILGLFSMSQKVALSEERHRQMLQVDQEQSALIHQVLTAQHDMQRQMDLMRERQALNIQGVESHRQLIAGIVQLNAEQQYQLNLVQERLRLLERTRRQPDQDQP